MKIINARRFSNLINALADLKSQTAMALMDPDYRTDAEVKVDQLIFIATSDMKAAIDLKKKHQAKRDQEFMDQFEMPEFKRPQREWSGTSRMWRELNKSDSPSQELVQKDNDDETIKGKSLNLRGSLARGADNV